MATETILVVDDNQDLANLMAGRVLPQLGYQTLVAYDAGSALEIIREHHLYIDLVLLDLQLPDMDGLDLLRKLSGEGHNIPAIVTTGHGSEQIAADAFRIGVQDYLPKPVETSDLKRAIAHALSEGRLLREKASLTAQLQEQVSWLRALYKVGRSVTASLEVDEVLRRIVEAAVELTQAEEGFLALLESHNQKLYLRAAKNIDENKTRPLHLPVDDSLVGSVMRSGRPLRTNLVAPGAQLKVATGYMVNSLLHVPILSKGKPLGVLSVDNRLSTRGFKESDEALLISLADYASVAIENASLYTQAQQEITERKKAESALRESEERYVLAVRGANDGIWDWDLKAGQIYFSPRWKIMLGYAEEEIGSRPEEWFGRIHPEDRERVRLEMSQHIQEATSTIEIEHRMLHKDDTYRWVLSRGLAVRDEKGAATRIAGSQTDITPRKITEEKLLHDAFHDPLTGLPNRALFLDRLQYAVERSKRRSDYLYAVLFMDLDRFKDINDTLGHIMGDQLLLACGRIIQTMLRPTDTVARLGGDEFVILLEDINEVNDATRVADRVQKELTSTRLLDDYELYITTSIGIVLSVSGYQDPEEVLRDADIAMYRAKALGKARYEIFDPTMRERIMERLRLEKELRQAIERDELRIYYQPILSLINGHTSGFEALVRWQHPTRGLLPPSEFIPLAEETGIIYALDRWVLRKVCSQAKQWHTQFPLDSPLTMSVNISGKQISQPDLVEFVDQVLAETGFDPHCLNLEITESAIMEDGEITSSVLSRLQALGVKIRIDDFGRGYSSLSYLSQFPINALKIDYLFVSAMAHGDKNSEIVQAIVMLAHSLGLQVIAEGVETEKQLNQLKEMGCENAQGYFICRPLSYEDTRHLIEGLLPGPKNV